MNMDKKTIMFETAIETAWVLEIMAKKNGDKQLIELAESNRVYFESLAAGLGIDLEPLIAKIKF